MLALHARPKGFAGGSKRVACEHEASRSRIAQTIDGEHPALGHHDDRGTVGRRVAKIDLIAREFRGHREGLRLSMVIL
ncbi:MAG: hypothetical protein ABWZ53_11775, partial [Actinomycetota bacterium]